MSTDPGSFRDPDGGILYHEDRVYRYFTASGAAKFEAVEKSGLLDRLVRDSLLIESHQVDSDVIEQLQQTIPDGTYFVEHPRLPFVSYCYEWPFEMLKSAALIYLQVLLIALESGYILKDASPYNVQFVGPKPLLIDVASFEEYQEDRPWAGYNQFCRLFLNPLILRSISGVRFQPWLRGSLDGIDPAELSRLLSWRHKLRPKLFVHVVLQAWLQRNAGASLEFNKDVTPTKISKRSLITLVSRLRSTVSGLRPRGKSSSWLGYDTTNSYDAEDRTAKEAFIEKVLEHNKPNVVWDLGCNTGHYSLLAAKHANSVVAFDQDPEVVNVLYRKAVEDETNILPLVMDLVDPSPEQGWAQRERMGIIQRGEADMVLVLALSHHIAISGNIPLPSLMEWLARISRGGIIEFVPKSDLALQVLLRWREDIYTHYSQAKFEDALSRHFQVTEQCVLHHSGRVLYSFVRHSP